MYVEDYHPVFDPLTSVTGTSEISYYNIPGTDIHLLDSPGFDDRNRTDTEILAMISSFLEDCHSGRDDIIGCLYVHPITSAKMTRSAMTNLRMFKNIIGMDKMTHVRLVTTKWSLQPKGVLEDHERDLASNADFWQPLIKRGAESVRFADSFESAMEIIRPLVHGHAFKPHLLEERLKGTTIPQTEAGQVVNDKVEEAVKAGKRQVEELEKEWKDAMNAKEIEWAKQLREEQRVQQAELDRALDEVEQMKKLNEQKSLSRGRAGRWVARGAAACAGGFFTLATAGFGAPAAALLYGSVEANCQLQKGIRR